MLNAATGINCSRATAVMGKTAAAVRLGDKENATPVARRRAARSACTIPTGERDGQPAQAAPAPTPGQHLALQIGSHHWSEPPSTHGRVCAPAPNTVRVLAGLSRTRGREDPYRTHTCKQLHVSTLPCDLTRRSRRKCRITCDAEGRSPRALGLKWLFCPTNHARIA